MKANKPNTLDVSENNNSGTRTRTSIINDTSLDELEQKLLNDKSFQHILKFAPASQRELMTFELAKYFQALFTEHSKNNDWLTIRIRKDGSRIDPENVEAARLFDKHAHAIAKRKLERMKKEVDRLARIDQATYIAEQLTDDQLTKELIYDQIAQLKRNKGEDNE